MADNKPDRPGAKAPPVINRLKWLAEMTRTRKYSRLEVAVAGALAWDFTDKETAETFVKPETVAKHINATLRPVDEAYALFRKDGWLERISTAAPGRAARYRLTFPKAQSATAQKPERKPAALPSPAPQEPEYGNDDVPF
jgi:hypothetical protein